MQIEYTQATDSDGTQLADIRVVAMKASLESIGRFEPNRARSRFFDKYVWEDTIKILADNLIVGFYSVIEKSDHLYLAHLYILPEFQGRGIGAQVLKRVKVMAVSSECGIRLGALKKSPSNKFYLTNGFKLTHEEKWDLYYEWHNS